MIKLKKEIHRNFTMIPNEIARSQEIDNAAKGLFLTLFSYPDDYKFSERNLAATCKDGLCRIQSQIQQLEKAGYLVRRCIKENGKIKSWEYIISDEPLPEEVRRTAFNYKPKDNQEVASPNENEVGRPEKSETEISDTVFSHTENPHMENQDMENPYNYKIKSEQKKKNKDFSLSCHQEETVNKKDETDRPKPSIIDSKEAMLSENPDISIELNYAIGLVEELYLSKKKTVAISGVRLDIKDVLRKLSTITDPQLIATVKKTKGYQPKNPRAYILTALYNAPEDRAYKSRDVGEDKNYSFDLQAYKELSNDFSSGRANTSDLTLDTPTVRKCYADWALKTKDGDTTFETYTKAMISEGFTLQQIQEPYTVNGKFYRPKDICF